MRTATWFLSGLFLIAACGGKTETGGEAGSGATAGSGGSSKGGGSGKGGGGGSGGVLGGAGGTLVGGSGGGILGGAGGVPAGGSGGTSVGGSGGNPGGLKEKAAALCDAVSKTSCPLEDCMQEVSQAIDISFQIGCADELEALFDCALKYPLYCGPGGEPAISPACDAAQNAFEGCAGSDPGCGSWGSSSGECGMDCNDWSVTCKPVSGGMVCTCTAGPNPGAQFKITGSCGGPEFENMASGTCG